MEQWHVKGNNTADELAGQVPDLHRVPELVSRDIRNNRKKLRLIQKRLIAVTQLLPQREHNEHIADKPYKPSYKDIINRAVRESKHTCIKQGTRVHCTVCKINISIHAEHIMDFLSSSCLPHEDRPSNSITIGKQSIQHTHNIKYTVEYIYMHKLWCHSKKKTRDPKRPL